MCLSPAEHLQALQNEILEAIARGDPLVATMEKLCRRVEAIAPGTTCSIVSIDEDRRLVALASPSLPEQYARAVDGLPIGPSVGSCGTAIYRGEAVEIEDIATDPLWHDYRKLALPLGLLAAWSSPIRARDERVIGAFAFYYGSRRRPTELERLIVATCVHLCAIAIEREEVQTRNHRLAYYDALTGLPNRACFNEAITRLSAEQPADFGLLLIDIDHLKTINDTMGHAVGDAMIAAIGARLGTAIGEGTACRLGGDEFAVLLPRCRESAQLRTAAGAILAAIAAPLDHDGHSINPSATIGGALAGEDGLDSTTLRQNADFALYHAKETRRGGYVRFRSGLRTSMTRRIQTRRMVDRALDEGRIVAHYQPVIGMDGNGIIGLEALARMRMDDGRIIAAGEFHEALLDPKVAYRITGQMMAAIAEDLANWRRAGLQPGYVSLNVTSADFEKGDLAQRITRALEKQRLPLGHLVIEITEQVFMGGRRNTVARTIEALRERGIAIALDDFGTGYASLTHLLDFPVDIIKIDRAFVGAILSETRSSVIVEAMLGIAKRLGMAIVAEGIETQAQAQQLHAMGCRLGQGHLYSPAVPAGIVAELMQRFGRPAEAQSRPLAAVTATAA